MSGDPNVGASVFKSKFGYSSASYGSYDYNIVKSNLRSNRPVIIGSSGGPEVHGWVCDGFQEINTCVYADDGSGTYLGSCTYLLFHMVWGEFYSNSDGWFYYNNFNPGSHNYNYNNTMIYNIIP